MADVLLPAAVDVRPCPWVAEVRTPFCLSFGEYPMFGLVVEEAKKITQVFMPLPEEFQPSSCYSSALAAFAPLT